MNRIMKKSLIFLLSLFVLVLLVFFINKQINYLYGNKKIFLEKAFPKSVSLIYYFLTENEKTNLKNLNDYNVKFLPNTQTIDLELKKIKVGLLKESDQGYMANIKRKRYAFKFSRFKDYLIIASPTQIIYIDMNELESDKTEFKTISHNLPSDKHEIRDILVYNDDIFISVGTKLNENCRILEIRKSKINNFQKLNFETIFSSPECALNGVEAGRIQIFKDDRGNDYILVTTAADYLIDENESDIKPQSNKSIFGKIIQINLNDGLHNIFSKGHRNSLGLFVDNEKKIILQTENGPRGGDEINLIKKGFNYGWNIASYGTKYKNNESSKYSDYKLSHEKNGFEEPIFSFVPSIGITQIIKIGKNFSYKWEDNYLIGSLNSKHIYRVKFDQSYNKVLFVEKIFVGERIRDLFYLEDQKKILIAMEESGSIGIIENKNSDN